jgi:hypothetical protein
MKIWLRKVVLIGLNHAMTESIDMHNPMIKIRSLARKESEFKLFLVEGYFRLVGQ